MGKDRVLREQREAPNPEVSLQEVKSKPRPEGCMRADQAEEAEEVGRRSASHQKNKTVDMNLIVLICQV